MDDEDKSTVTPMNSRYTVPAVYVFLPMYNDSTMANFNISNTVKKYPKSLPYQEIKLKIMGAKYQLSLVFVGKTRATSLNKQYRNKNYSPNVLSFPLSDKAGEIFICPQTAKVEAAKFNLSVNGYIAFLFIHGLLHLKGYDHGDTMDEQEIKYIKLFNIK